MSVSKSAGARRQGHAGEQKRRAAEQQELIEAEDINIENDKRRGGDVVTAMRQEFTTRSSVNHSNHNGSSH